MRVIQGRSEGLFSGIKASRKGASACEIAPGCEYLTGKIRGLASMVLSGAGPIPIVCRECPALAMAKEYGADVLTCTNDLVVTPARDVSSILAGQVRESV